MDTTDTRTSVENFTGIGTITEDRLEKLGFKVASLAVKEKKLRARKLALAYEHYRFVREEKVKEFNSALYGLTYGRSLSYNYQQLDFTPIESYEKVPPADVLEKLEVAQALEVAGVKVFDSYEVAYIRNVKDPLLFGRVNGCSDRFYIAGWDEDIKISDLIKENEG